MQPSKAVLRIIDANLNRLGEGLRFLEEVARFILDDAGITSELKNLRHRLSPKNPDIKSVYLDAREAAGDVGQDIKLDAEESGRNLSQATAANARRVQESLRVLEELAKTTKMGLDAAELQDARFTVYALEKTLLTRLMRKDRSTLLCGLHVIVDAAVLGAYSPVDIARGALLGGARIIHLRDRIAPMRKFLGTALEIAGLCRKHGALFIVNDALDIALAARADGLYLDQEDLPVRVARELLPIHLLIGCSVQNVSEAEQAYADGADYLGYKVVFATATETDSQAPDDTPIAQIKKGVPLPLIAAMNISERNAADALRSGADGIAVAGDAALTEIDTHNLIKAMEVSREPSKQ